VDVRERVGKGRSGAGAAVEGGKKRVGSIGKTKNIGDHFLAIRAFHNGRQTNGE
jgi:hypothetical protein